MSVLFAPRRILRLRLSSLEGSWSSSCQGFICLFCLSFSGLEGSWGSSCLVLSQFFDNLCLFFQDPRDPGAAKKGYQLFLLCVLFGPRGILGLQLSVIVYFLCLFFSGLGRILGLQLSSSGCFLCWFFLFVLLGRLLIEKKEKGKDGCEIEIQQPHP